MRNRPYPAPTAAARNTTGYGPRIRRRSTASSEKVVDATELIERSGRIHRIAHRTSHHATRAVGLMCRYDGTDDATGHRPHPAGPDGCGAPRVHHREDGVGVARERMRARPAAGRDAAADADRGTRHRLRRDRTTFRCASTGRPSNGTTNLPVVVYYHGGGWASATWTPTTRRTRPRRRHRGHRGIGGLPAGPRTPVPAGASRTPGPHCSGSASAPPNWAATRRASRWSATRRAATWRRWSR